MSADYPLVYIVILNWNGAADTIEALLSVEQLTYPRYCVVVVDNASTDESVCVIRERFPHVPLIANTENLGCAGGNNVGIAYALEHSADYVFIMNNDAVVEPGLLEALVAEAQKDSTVGILAPKILYYHEPTRIWNLGAECHWYAPLPVSPGLNRADGPMYQQVRKVDLVTGCGMLVRRAVFERIGLLDTRFFMYYEDSDFCRRAQEAGFQVLVVPSARMWHKVSRSTSDQAPAQRYYKTRYRVQFYRRHRYGPHPLLTHMLVLASVVRNAARDLLRGDSAAARATLRGWRDGWLPPGRGCDLDTARTS
ncbi:MAG: glycosyltransferase family 2 protein [Chloroflexi bacterium]|nr:glycosyltransferase family 2 protein [Chloroflexota bacterium]